MGQNPSKRRSYTPGQDVNAEIPSPTPANGDLKIDVTANGSRIEHGDVPEPISPTSIASTSSTGKKEKRRKLRFVGFPIRRTPSGRWTRKRRSVKANGANPRPVSCPVPSLTREGEATIPRPQSLFAKEFEVHEEDGDGKVETVDLSDNEEGKAKQENKGTAPIPKPREKKAKRISDKKAENKKKKKDKKNKDKDMKRTSVDSQTVEVPSDPKNENTVEDHADTLIPQSRKRDMSNPESSKDGPDLASVAASIVQDTVNNAKQKLMAEQTIPKGVFSSGTNKAEIEGEIPHPISTVTMDQEVREVVETSETIRSSAEGNTLVEAMEEEIIPVKALEKNRSIPVLLHSENSIEDERKGEIEIEAVTSDTNEKAARSSFKEASQEIMDGTEVIGVVTEDLTVSSLVSNVSRDEPTEVIEETITEQRVDKVRTVPNIDSYISAIPRLNQSLKDKDIDNMEDSVVASINAEAEYQETNGQTEKISEMETGEPNSAPETGGILSTTSESVPEKQTGDLKAFTSAEEKNSSIAEPSPQNAGPKHLDEIKENLDKVTSDTEQNKEPGTNTSKDQKDKESAEKELHQREKECVREEKRKKADGKSVKKPKSKGDRKSLPQRISSWFKKDKPKFGTASTAPETPSEKPSHSVDESVPNSSVPPDGISASSHTKESLTVDVSVQPYAGSQDTGNCRSSPNASPTEDDIHPDSAQISPTSEANVTLNSDSAIPVSPTSDEVDVDIGGPPGALKKINLGPRLRTAILRKKSSSASDSGQEDKRVSLTQPKSIETLELTPPPRKLRQRKAAEHYTPVTKGAHNPPKIHSPELDHGESKEAFTAEEQKGDMENVSLPPDFKTIINMGDNTESLSSSLIVENVNEASKSSKEQEIVDTDENTTSSFPEEIDNKNETHTPFTGEEIVHNEQNITSPTTNELILNNCDADNIISTNEDEIIVSGTSITFPVSEEKSSNEEHVTSSLEAEIVDHRGEGITPSATKELNEKIESASSVLVSSEDLKKEFVNKEIKQQIQAEGAECYSIEQTNFQCQQLKPGFEETIEKEEPEKEEADRSHISITPPALDLSLHNDSSIQPKENEDEQKQSSDVEESIDSPSLISTATITFKTSISDNSPPCSPTTEESNEPFSNNLPQEIQEGFRNSLQAEANDIAESNGTVVSELTQSNKTAEWADVQCSVKDSSDDRNFAMPELNAPESVIITGLTNENECISPSLESQKIEKDKTGDLDKDDTVPESTAVCMENDLESVTEQNHIEGETDAETSFITLSANGEDPLANGELAVKVLDIHNLDDSAIEMDKDSPLADNRTPCSVNVSKEDDGVGSSDNSSDCNDSSKSGPSATIDAYLKLQHAEADIGQAASEINGLDLSSTE